MPLKSNAEELALIAQEIGAEVIRGPARPSRHREAWRKNRTMPLATSFY